MEEMTSTEKRNEQEILFMTKTINKLKSYLKKKEKDHEEASKKISSSKTVAIAKMMRPQSLLGFVLCVSFF